MKIFLFHKIGEIRNRFIYLESNNQNNTSAEVKKGSENEGIKIEDVNSEISGKQKCLAECGDPDSLNKEGKFTEDLTLLQNWHYAEGPEKLFESSFRTEVGKIIGGKFRESLFAETEATARSGTRFLNDTDNSGTTATLLLPDFERMMNDNQWDSLRTKLKLGNSGMESGLAQGEKPYVTIFTRLGDDVKGIRGELGTDGYWNFRGDYGAFMASVGGENVKNFNKGLEMKGEFMAGKIYVAGGVDNPFEKNRRGVFAEFEFAMNW